MILSKLITRLRPRMAETLGAPVTGNHGASGQANVAAMLRFTAR
jgi:hypothetical protein